MNPPNLEAIVQAKQVLIELALRYGPRLFTAFLIFVIGLIAARRLGRASGRWLARRELEPLVQKLIARILSLLVLVLFVMMALQNLGVELLPLVASLGIVGVGAGLAMQGVLSNLIAGLTIIFTRPFRVGEYISIIGVEGKVESVDLFTTILLHSDRSQVVIPNRKLVGEVLHNYGKIRQLNLAVGVAYATDLNHAVGLIREVLNHNPRVLIEPAAVVGVTTLGDSSIHISICPWVAVSDYVNTIGEINHSVVEACRAQHIEIAFPQREVRILGSTGAA